MPKRSKQVGSLLLGLYDDAGLLHHVGYTSSIAAKDRDALTKELETLIATPGFTGNAPGGPSRWSTERSTAVAAAQTHARRRGPLRPGHRPPLPPRHRLLRRRPDKDPNNARSTQLAPPLTPAAAQRNC